MTKHRERSEQALSAAKCTPGPWEADCGCRFGPIRWDIPGLNGLTFCPLHAAASELLATLRSIACLRIDHPDNMRLAKVFAEDAIAKAGG